MNWMHFDIAFCENDKCPRAKNCWRAQGKKHPEAPRFISIIKYDHVDCKDFISCDDYLKLPKGENTFFPQVNNEVEILEKAYLICPVRKQTENEKIAIDKAIAEIRKEYDLYIPYEHPQDIDGSLIHERNRKHIVEAKIVFIWWKPDSIGSHVDLGMAFILGHPLKVLNKIIRTEGKSYSNVLDDLRIKD